MKRTEEFRDQQGYFAFVQNSDVDYLRLAYAQALSIKATQRFNKYAIAVDPETKLMLEDKHMKVFDYVVDIPFGDDAKDSTWKIGNAWKLYACTPFKETINLDCDMLFTRDVSHWIHQLRKREICITTNVVDFRGNVAGSRKYRRVFDDNNLLNTYNAFSYFRYSQTSHNFFTAMERIFHNWPVYRDKVLKNCRVEYPTTDEVYALAASEIGQESCYIPGSYPTFCHMKPAIQGWQEMDWRNAVSWTLTDQMDLIVGGYYQMYPFHYNVKDFITDELINRYEEANKG